MTKPLILRMASKFTIGPDCWEWTASRPHGYGQISVGGRAGRPRRAHIVLWELLHGPVPDGLELDHTCRNTACIRPAHLEPVTHAENMRRARGLNRPTHCKHDHELTPENTYVELVATGGTAWKCRTCRARRNREYRQRLKERTTYAH